MLALADYNGDIFGSWGGIARQANIHWRPEDGTISPFKVLMSPDPDSSDTLRNPENEGKRIEEIEGGFRIINYAFYRGLRNDDDRREQNRTAQAAYRKRSKPKSAKVSQGKPQSAHAEAEAEAEKIYIAFPLKVGKPAALRAIKSALTVAPFEYLLEKTKEFTAARNGDLTFCPNPSTWFNQHRYNDDPQTWKPKVNSARPDFTRQKEKAPCYPKMSESREPTDEERQHILKIAAEEKEKLRKSLTPDQATQ